MDASLLEWTPANVEVRSLTVLVEQLRPDVGELRRETAELRRENEELRREVAALRCDVGYWKSMHARAVERNGKLQEQLDGAHAEIRNLKRLDAQKAAKGKDKATLQEPWRRDFKRITGARGR